MSKFTKNIIIFLLRPFFVIKTLLHQLPSAASEGAFFYVEL